MISQPPKNNLVEYWDFKAYMNTYREIQVAMSLMLISVEG